MKTAVFPMQKHTEGKTINWKDIEGFEGLYQVSDVGGNVKSLGRTLANGRTFEEKILKPSMHRSGYSTYVLCKNGVKVSTTVHLLVLETFKCKRPKGMIALHNDGNPHNNDLSNLRWGTYRENSQDAIKHGTFVTGSKNGKAKLSEQQVREIKLLIKAGSYQRLKDIADKYKVVTGAINNIKYGLTWKQIQV